MPIDDITDAKNIIKENFDVTYHFTGKEEDDIGHAGDSYVFIAKLGPKPKDPAVVLKVYELKDKKDEEHFMALMKQLKRVTDKVEYQVEETDSLVPINQIHSQKDSEGLAENQTRYALVEFRVALGDLDQLLKKAKGGRFKKRYPKLEKLVKAYKKDKEGFALKVATQSARVLSCVHEHEQRMIHRDFKPANVLLNPGPKIWLSDFQTWYWIDRNRDMHLDQTLTLQGQLVGTPLYIPPEDIKAAKILEVMPENERPKRNPSNKTQSRDIDALGLTLYQMLATVPQGELGNIRGAYKPKNCARGKAFATTKNDTPEEFFKYLNLEREVKDIVFREIIKKCLQYDKSAVENWVKIFDRWNEEFEKEGKSSIEIPWKHRYQDYRELLRDLAVAGYYKQREQIEDAMSVSIESSDAVEKRGKAVSLWQEVIVGLRNHPDTKGTDLDGIVFEERKGKNRLLDMFEEEEITPTVKDDTEYMKSEYSKFDARFETISRVTVRLGISHRLRELGKIWGIYGKIREESEGEDLKKESFDKLADKYDPDKYLDELCGIMAQNEGTPDEKRKDPKRKIENEDIADATKDELRNFLKLIKTEKKDPEFAKYENQIDNLDEIVRNLRIRILERRKEIRKIRKEVREACYKAEKVYRQGALSLSYNASSISKALEVLDTINEEYRGFYRVSAIRLDLVSTDIARRKMYGISEDGIHTLQDMAQIELDKLKGREPQYADAIAKYHLSKQDKFGNIPEDFERFRKEALQKKPREASE